MPHYLSSLIVILGLTGLVTWVTQKAFTLVLPTAVAVRMRWLLLLLPVAAFVSPAAAVYFVGLAVVLLWGLYLAPVGATGQAPFQEWRLAAWFGLLMAVPPIPVNIIGVGGVDYFFAIDHVRALNLMLLLPLWVRKGNETANDPFRMTLTDWSVLLYLGWAAISTVPYNTTTHSLRRAFELMVDGALPYWVLRQALQSREGLRLCLTLLLQAMLLLALVGVFETLRGWPLYDGVARSWGEKWSLTTYLMRDGLLRARGSTGHSLALGFVMVVALCLWPWVARSVQSKGWRLMGWAVLLGGLLASLSRGAWLGAGVAALALALLSQRPARNAVVVGAMSLAAFAVLAATSGSFADLVSRLGSQFGGGTSQMASEYRVQLFNTAMALIVQSPIFGVPDYLTYMEHLRQGQGIIDIVNSYLGVTLGGGLVALVPFLGIFLGPLPGLWKLHRKQGAAGEGGGLAGCLMALTVGEMVLLSSTSSISVIGTIYFAMAGLAVATVRLYAPLPPETKGLWRGA